MNPCRIGALAEADEPDAIETLAAAFRDNPLNRAVIGGDPQRRLRSNRAGMLQIIPNIRRKGTALAGRTPAGLGVLLANPPDTYPLGPPRLRSQLWALLAQGPRTALRWQSVFEHMDGFHPLEPHWYLATLGVDPCAQGNGVGGALLAALLRRSDADQLPTWLETDRAQNLPFYERAGFRTVRETRIFDVRIWHMHRRALRSAGPAVRSGEETAAPFESRTRLLD